jgi:hypothetical protein
MYYLGSFKTKQEAALAYDKAARQCGKDVLLNYDSLEAAEEAAAYAQTECGADAKVRMECNGSMNDSASMECNGSTECNDSQSHSIPSNAFGDHASVAKLSNETTAPKKLTVAQPRNVISLPSAQLRVVVRLPLAQHSGHSRPTTTEPLNSVLYVLDAQLEHVTVIAIHRKPKAARAGWFSVRTESGDKMFLLFTPEGKGTAWEFGKLSGNYDLSIPTCSYPARLALPSAGTMHSSASLASSAKVAKQVKQMVAKKEGEVEAAEAAKAAEATKAAQQPPGGGMLQKERPEGGVRSTVRSKVDCASRNRPFVRPEWAQGQPYGRKPADKALHGMFDEKSLTSSSSLAVPLQQICNTDFTMVPFTRLVLDAERRSTQEFLKEFTVVDEDTFKLHSKYITLGGHSLHAVLHTVLTVCCALYCTH